MAKRTIIQHYHLFKNAGTSVDQILKNNFADRWATKEFTGQNNSAAVVDWIVNTPNAVAFSSHTMMGPIPHIPGTKIISLVMLRDPIARICSAYGFERRQQSENFGAVLAQHTDFEGYVRSRLALPHDRQCRNFQTWYLAALNPGPEPELERAIAALTRISVVGLVETFSDSMTRLKTALSHPFPSFSFENIRLNTTKKKSPDQGFPKELGMLLQEANFDDSKLIRQAQKTVQNACHPKAG